MPPSIDPQWLTIVVFIVQILISIILALIGFGMKIIMGDLKEVTKDLREFQKDIFKNGDSAMRATFEKYREETRLRLHNYGDRIGALEGIIRVIHKLELPTDGLDK